MFLDATVFFLLSLLWGLNLQTRNSQKVAIRKNNYLRNFQKLAIHENKSSRNTSFLAYKSKHTRKLVRLR